MDLVDLSEDNVRSALKYYEALFARGDVEAIVAGFTDDVRVRYGAAAPFSGKAGLRQMLQRRFDGMHDYQLSKQLEFVCAPRIAASWTGTWIDRRTDTKMAIFGIEVLTVETGKFCAWSASVSTWRHGEAQP